MIVVDALLGGIALAAFTWAARDRRARSRAERVSHHHREAARERLITIQRLQDQIEAARRKRSDAISRGNRTRAAKRRLSLEIADTG